jgi:hypothetical protein
MEHNFTPAKYAKPNLGKALDKAKGMSSSHSSLDLRRKIKEAREGYNKQREADGLAPKKGNFKML